MNRRSAQLLTLFLLLAAAVTARADQVDDLVKAEMSKQRIPGVSIAVLKDGKVIKIQGYGLANVELNIPATPETVYKIGSISKQFIATGIMLLVEEGKLSLDDRVGKYLEGTPDSWQPITIRHFLTHTSGVVREGPGFDPFKVQSDADVITTAYPLPLRFKPGEKWEYCNVGYFSLAEIIRKVSGKPWGDFINERVFAPLGMTASRVTSVTAIVPNRASGYALDNDGLKNTEDWPAIRPSGAFLSTVVDLAKWESALQTNRILKQATVQQMFTPVTLNSGRKHPYGFGWELQEFRGISMVRHGGTLTGFRAHFARFPEHRITVIVLSNLRNANVEAVATGVAVRFIPEINLALLAPRPSPNPDLTKLLKTFLVDFARGAKELPQATPEFSQALNGAPASSRQVLTDRLKGSGDLEYLTHKDVNGKGFERLGVPAVTVWQYKLGSADQANYCTFYLTAEGKVAFMDIRHY